VSLGGGGADEALGSELRQWLLSKEFDELVALLSRDAEGVPQRKQLSVA